MLGFTGLFGGDFLACLAEYDLAGLISADLDNSFVFALVLVLEALAPKALVLGAGPAWMFATEFLVIL